MFYESSKQVCTNKTADCSCMLDAQLSSILRAILDNFAGSEIIFESKGLAGIIIIIILIPA